MQIKTSVNSYQTPNKMTNIKKTENILKMLDDHMLGL